MNLMGEKTFGGLTRLINVGQVTDALKMTRDQDVWKDMIAKVKKKKKKKKQSSRSVDRFLRILNGNREKDARMVK